MMRAFILGMLLTGIALVSLNMIMQEKPIVKMEIIQADDIIVDPNKIPKFSEHNRPKKGIEYNGTYEGMLPCADCKGTKITLNLMDGHYSQTVTRIGVASNLDECHTGLYQWDEIGEKFQIDSPAKSKYQFKDGNLQQLNMNGIGCLSVDGNPFVLYKQP